LPLLGEVAPDAVRDLGGCTEIRLQPGRRQPLTLTRANR